MGNWNGRALDESRRILLTAKGDIFYCHILYSILSLSWSADGALESALALSQTGMKVLHSTAVRAAGQHSVVCSILTP